MSSPPGSRLGGLDQGAGQPVHQGCLLPHVAVDRQQSEAKAITCLLGVGSWHLPQEAQLWQVLSPEPKSEMAPEAAGNLGTPLLFCAHGPLGTSLPQADARAHPLVEGQVSRF